MPEGEKKPILAELKAYPLKEMGKEAREFITKSKVLSKKFAPIIWSAKPVVDPRKWTKKKLSDGLSAVARYEMKVLAVRASKIAKDAAGKGKADKAEKELAKAYDEIKKEILDKVSLAVDEVEADKGDNKKSLKDCKGAFEKLKKVDIDGMYSSPRSYMVDVFSDLMDVLDDADEKKKAKLLAAAAKNVGGAIKEFDDNGKAATTAIDTLLNAAKNTKANKGVDPELGAFAALVLKEESKISSVLAKSKKFSDALANAEKAVKSGEMDGKGAKVHAEIFKKMANLDGTAKETLSKATRLENDFKKIAKKLK